MVFMTGQMEPEDSLEAWFEDMIFEGRKKEHRIT
jgi:hypothetical protein